MVGLTSVLICSPESVRNSWGKISVTLNAQSVSDLRVNVNPFLMQIPVNHGGHTGVGPDVFGRFNHVDDGVDGQDDA